MQLKFNFMHSEFHPNDDREDSCGGWQEAIKISSFEEFIKTINYKDRDKYRYNRDVYNEYLEKCPEANIYKIEPYPVAELGAILLAQAELYFAQVSEQASRKINTNNMENSLQRIKASIILLSKYKNYQVAEIPKVNVMGFDENTKLSVLSSFPLDVQKYCTTDEGDIGLIPIDIPYLKERLYIIVPPKKREINIKLGFDGEHFVATYPENIKSLNLPQNVIAMLPAPSTQNKTEEKLEERMHGDIMEHKHEDHDYWHPATRVHPKKDE